MTLAFAPLFAKKKWKGNALEYLGVWEKIKNPDFNYPEFGVIGQEAGTNRFIMSAGQWIDRTKAIGMLVKAGRYGGTFAHKDIAFHFAMWLSPEFQIYLINAFQRLKDDENNRLNLEWSVQRTISKINYHIHTDAIKENLIPKEITRQQAGFVYANEADLLNVALFGTTAKERRDRNPGKTGNIRDHAALEQLVVLSNMESINALLIKPGLTQGQRLLQLNQVAITQMRSLIENKTIKRLNDQK
ncbi:KilA-N domain-containing protein [Niabella drilacis]|uniref:KilA-N domain-containing protein n=1 Tax=Niabella drilacis (strain DSM 25811 / CCM 8410 / CCUG 62505 / LMG 26954 / E90) TaxID=1285928 RepID=UPI001C409956|nr:KilA-N domain-containing protein [Niabella drilacis]